MHQQGVGDVFGGGARIAADFVGAGGELAQDFRRVRAVEPEAGMAGDRCLETGGTMQFFGGAQNAVQRGAQAENGPAGIGGVAGLVELDPGRADARGQAVVFGEGEAGFHGAGGPKPSVRRRSA